MNHFRLNKLFRLNVKRGFSIVELLVVISIIGIFMAIAVVSATAVRKNSRIKTETATVSSLMQSAKLYGQKTRAFPPGSASLSYNSDGDGDNCSMCFLSSGDTSNASIEWQAAVDAMLSEGTLDEAVYVDQWDNPYAYDNNAGGAPNPNYWSAICSMGPDGELQTAGADFPITNISPEGQGDDICVFFRP